MLRDQPAPEDSPEILTILDEDQLNSWTWYDLNDNLLRREGARLYDLDSDGHADWLYLAMRDNQSADADPTPDDIRLEQVIAADMSKIFEGQGLGDIALSPLFTPAEHQAVQLTTKAGRDGVLQNTDVPVQLSASIEGRTNSFGMVIVKDGESTDLSSLSGFDELTIAPRSCSPISNSEFGPLVLTATNLVYSAAAAIIFATGNSFQFLL